MKIKLKDIKEGDFVHCTGDSSFCDSSDEIVKKVTIKYDGDSGKPFNVIHLSEGRKFDSRHGGAMNSPLAYYIIPTDQNSAKNEHNKKSEEDTKRKADFDKREEDKKTILQKLTKKERQILGFN